MHAWLSSTLTSKAQGGDADKTWRWKYSSGLTLHQSISKTWYVGACRMHTQAEGENSARVTLTRPAGPAADGVIVGMSPTNFDRTQQVPPRLSILPCHRTCIPAVIAPRFGIYTRPLLLPLTPNHSRDMEPGPSTPDETDRRNVSEPPKMRLHGGNIPTIPQDKLCPHCPAKFTRWAIFEPVPRCYRWLG